MKNYEKLKKFLKENVEDCLELKRKKDLTKEGKQQLVFLEAIYQHMGWKIKDGA